MLWLVTRLPDSVDCWAMSDLQDFSETGGDAIHASECTQAEPHTLAFETPARIKFTSLRSSSTTYSSNSRTQRRTSALSPSCDRGGGGLLRASLHFSAKHSRRRGHTNRARSVLDSPTPSATGTSDSSPSSRTVNC